MAHTILGTVVLLIALTLVAIAIVMTPVFRYLQIRKVSRFAFGAMMISLGGYLAWVAQLFYRDELAPVNYTPELVVIRLVALAASLWFLGAATRCSLEIARRDEKVSTRLVRENGHEHPCPKCREDDS